MVRGLGLVMLTAAVLAGCGEDEQSAGGVGPNPTIEAARECLRAAGFEPVGGASEALPGDDDVPDGELIVEGSTFIAFYDAAARAEQLAPELRANAEELGGTTTRHDRITVLYASEPDERIERCVG